MLCENVFLHRIHVKVAIVTLNYLCLNNIKNMI
jgi:hypothetical protein